MVHGEEALAAAQRASEAVFGGDLAGLDARTLLEIFDGVPSSDLPAAALSGGTPLIDALTGAGVFASKGEARRLVQNGGLYLNSRRVDALDAKLGPECLLTDNLAVVRTGKKNYHLLRFV